MATSSITKDFTIDSNEACEAFIKALEESKEKVLSKKIDYSKDNSYEEGVEKLKLYCLNSKSEHRCKFCNYHD